MISKNRINQAAREFKNLEDNYLMGIVYNTFLKELRVCMIVPDLLTNTDMVIVDYKTDYKTIKELSNFIEYKIKE